MLARGFVSGSCLAVRAPGRDDHAHHVVVEFVHPVVPGARALPAVAAGPRAPDRVGTDIELVIDDTTNEPDGHLMIPAHIGDARIMFTYHVLWELVHIALEHPGLVGSGATAGGDTTGFLYPFLDGAGHDGSGRDEAALRQVLDDSVRAKRDESKLLGHTTVDANAAELAAATSSIRAAVSHGGRVLTMGNGGSGADAARVARLLAGGGVEALTLCTDYAVLTALSNDLGPSHVYARQVEALTRPGDVLIGCSTSGTSPNLHLAFERATRLGATTVAVVGYSGRAFADAAAPDHLLVVDSKSVHRIQEAQAELLSALCDAVLARPHRDDPHDRFAS